jgi:hypothetical protein
MCPIGRSARRQRPDLPISVALPKASALRVQGGLTPQLSDSALSVWPPGLPCSSRRLRICPELGHRFQLSVGAPRDARRRTLWMLRRNQASA